MYCGASIILLYIFYQAAMCVDIAMTEGSMMIKILPYSAGDIPVRVDNLCEDVFLKLHQKLVPWLSCVLSLHFSCYY